MTTYLQLDETALDRAGACGRRARSRNSRRAGCARRMLIRNRRTSIAGFLDAAPGAAGSAHHSHRRGQLGFHRRVSRAAAVAPARPPRGSDRHHGLAVRPHAVFAARRADAARVLRPLGQQPRERRGGRPGGTVAARVPSARVHLQRTGDALPALPRAAQQPRDPAAARNPRSELCHDLEFHGHDAGRLAGVPRRQRSAGRGADRASHAGDCSRSTMRRCATLAAESYSRVVYLGSNGFKALAREAALKLLELTRRLGDRRLRFAARLSPRTEDHRDTTTRCCSCSSPTIRTPAATIWICCANCAPTALAGRSSPSRPRPTMTVTQGEYLRVAAARRGG